MRKSPLALLVLLVLGLSSVAVADDLPATTITFSSLASSFDNGSLPIQNGYGALPTLGVSYNNACYWNSDIGGSPAGDLNNYAYACDSSRMQITFTPLEGTAWTLTSFDLGSIYDGAPYDVYLRDGNGTLLWSSGDLSITGTGHLTISPNVTFTSAATLDLGPTWDVGVSNIYLVDPRPESTPEPASVVLLGSALVAFAVRRRK